MEGILALGLDNLIGEFNDVLKLFARRRRDGDGDVEALEIQAKDHAAVAAFVTRPDRLLVVLCPDGVLAVQQSGERDRQWPVPDSLVAAKQICGRDAIGLERPREDRPGGGLCFGYVKVTQI
jgi:hypothetical protein